MPVIRLRIAEPTYTDVYNVARHMRSDDFREFSGVHDTDDPIELARKLADTYHSYSGVMVGHDDRGAVCVGGTIEARPNVITLLFFANDRFPGIALPITRFIRNNLFPKLVDRGIHRIEAVSMAAHTQSHAWLKTIGLTSETEPLRGFGKRGEAYIQFSWVAADVG